MKVRRLRPDEKARLLEMYDSGASQKLIARTLGCADSTIAYHLQKSGRPPAWKRTREEPEDKVYLKKSSAGYIQRVTRYYDNGKRRYHYSLEHRHIMAEHLGRPLQHHEQVHHRNGRRDDNRIENLELRVGAHGNGATHCPHCGGSITCR